MKTHTLSNGVKMPSIGFGTYKLTGENCYHSVLKAIEIGYRHIDTAMFYDNETEIGKAIKDSKIPREELFITTKMWYTDHGFESSINAFETSLKKLNLEYVDLYLIHWPGTSENLNSKELRTESWKGLQKIYKEGKAKAIGVSNYTIKHLEEMKEFEIQPHVNQVEFHVKLFQKNLLDYCLDHQIVLEAYSSLAKGKLLQSPHKEDLEKVSKGKSIAQIALRWAYQHDLVVIPKSGDEKRMKENFEISQWEIESKDMEFLDSLNEDFHCTWDPTTIE
jgi:methylglyoxal/glyoxal reductase